MKKKNKSDWVFIVFFLLGSNTSWAQPADNDEEALLNLYGDEEMISIATGHRQPIAKAPAVATVITDQDIRALGATDLDDVLETVPGLHVARDHINYNPIYTFRGIYASFNPQVLMLINGIPIGNLFHGDRNLMWGGMPVNSISRIEVIRGPGSAVYGADAFAGVINIITKSRAEIGATEVGARAGSFDTQDAWLLHGSTWNNIDIAFTLEYHQTEGQDNIIEVDAQSRLDTARGTNASLAPGAVNLSRKNTDMRLDIAQDNWRFRAGLQRRRDQGNGAGLSQALDPHNRYASDRWNADLTYHNPSVARHWNITAQVSYLDTTQEVEKDLILFPPGADLGTGVFAQGMIGNPEVFERHSRMDVSAFYSHLERHQIRMGLGYYYGDLYKTRETKNYRVDPATGAFLPIGFMINVTDTAEVFLTESARENYYGFIQDIWTLANDWELTTGMRVDHYSDFGSTVNPRLALVWSISYDLTGKFLVGRAFRAPSFAETRNSGNPVVLGNTGLDPETLESYELVLDYRPTESLHYSLNLFKYNWDKIIQFVPDGAASNNSRTARNEGRQTGYGLELEAGWRPLPSLQIAGNYALQHSTDENKDKKAGYTPQQQIYLQLNWEFFPHWHLHTRLNWVMDRPRHFGDSRKEIDDYRLVDLTINRRSAQGDWEFSLVARNLFDSDAREPSPFGGDPVAIPNDLPLAGRHYLGEIRYRF